MDHRTGEQSCQEGDPCALCPNVVVPTLPMSDKARHAYRKQLSELTSDLFTEVTIAKHYGRRTDCLVVAFVALRGALRNVCHEDAQHFGDPTVLEDCQTCWGMGTAERCEAVCRMPPTAETAPR